jgi:hypothetical protein
MINTQRIRDSLRGYWDLKQDRVIFVISAALLVYAALGTAIDLSYPEPEIIDHHLPRIYFDPHSGSLRLVDMPPDMTVVVRSTGNLNFSDGWLYPSSSNRFSALGRAAISMSSNRNVLIGVSRIKIGIKPQL